MAWRPIVEYYWKVIVPSSDAVNTLPTPNGHGCERGITKSEPGEHQVPTLKERDGESRSGAVEGRA